MAEHKAEDTTEDTTLLAERVKSIATIIAALYFIANTALASFGINPLPFANEDVASAVSAVGAVVMAIVAWWRQNIMTNAANQGHKLTTAIKTGQVALTQGTSPAPETNATTLADETYETERDVVTGTPVIHVGE